MASPRSILHDYNIRARKVWGQNFIINPQRLTQIAKCAGPLEGTVVIEVGAGSGALTRALLEQGALRVIAVEIDARCMKPLQDLSCWAGDRLIIYHGDALNLDLRTLEPGLYVNAPRIVFGNLPYYICVPLIVHWAQYAHVFQDFFLMFQKEVADRLTAVPGTSAYGRLTVMMQWIYRIKKLLNFSPRDFFPVPKVFSTLLRLTPLSCVSSHVSWSMMEKVVGLSFQKRRKMLRVILRSLHPNPETCLEAAGIHPTSRPETLSVQDFERLTTLLHQAD